MKTASVLACVAAAAALALPSVHGHGYLMVPKAKLASGDPTRFSIEKRGSTILDVPAGGSFSNTPQVNLDSYTKAFKASSFTSLRDMMEKKVEGGNGCGITPAGGDPQPLPGVVEWSSFVDSHVGPCEVWCDKTRVYQNDNCASMTSQPAKMTIDKSKCAGTKELKFLWLALHSQDWQFYIACVPLSGTGSASGGGGGGGGNAPAPTPAPRPVPGPEPTYAPSPVVRPTPAPPANNNNGNHNGNGNHNAGGDADCDDDLPEPDCDDEYPEPGDVGGEGDDCDDDLPEPDCDDDLPEPDCDDDLPEPDCDDDLPVAGNDKDEYGGESDNIGFDALQRGPKYSPGKAMPETGY